MDASLLIAHSRGMHRGNCSTHTTRHRRTLLRYDRDGSKPVFKIHDPPTMTSLWHLIISAADGGWTEKIYVLLRMDWPYRDWLGLSHRD